MTFLSRLRAILAFVLNRPLQVRLHRGDGHFFPAEMLVLPAISGGAEEASEEKEEEGGEEGKKEEPAKEEGKENEAEEQEEAEEKKGPDWKAESRKHERRSKKEKEAREAAEAKLKEREDEDKTEQEKAVEKAREEGKKEALTVAEKERRKDRLESAVTRAAGKKITIGEGDDAKTLRFDDPEDAELYLQRKISKGELDEDDLFDADGKVKADVVSDALKEILEEKPRLAEDGDSPKARVPAGGGDGGKGKEAGGKEDMNDLLRRRS